jgi:RNA polymerase sigma-70 factor (ECF subfamily)
VKTVDERTDSQLVHAVLDGDRAAFTQLVRRHDPALRRMVFAMIRNATELDDVLQDTYIKAFRSLGSFDGDSSFKAWLHRIGYTTTLDHIRSNKRRRTESLPEAGTSSASTESSAISKVDVVQALSKLSDAQRTALLLIDGHKFSYEEVASVLDIPSGTVGYQLHQARKQLRNLLGSAQ